MSARKINASEISSFLYCERAWWYQQQGTPPENTQELANGTALHQRHGRLVFTSALYQFAGSCTLLAALMVLAILLVQELM